MKKYIGKIFLTLAACLSFAACETTSVDELQTSVPVITSFSPISAPAGAEVVITGDFLNNVTAASIGGVSVDIVEKVSKTRMSIRISTEVTKGKIILTNPIGEGRSEQDFTSTYAVPSITASLLQSTAEMWETILISGENLNSVKDVLFTSEGYEGHAAAIVQQSDEELIIRVPYVETNSAKITFTYYDGGEQPVETSKETAPAITVVKYTPTFDSYSFERTAVGRSITLTGTNLEYVEAVSVQENGEETSFEAVFTKTSESLTFTIPAGDFEDGDHTVTVTATWFEGNESKAITDNFVIYVPFIRMWENITLWCQGRTEDNPYRSFFSPETGILYQNSVWRTELDPVAALLSNSQWGSANNPIDGAVTDEQYNSVVPYFFIAGNNNGTVNINSPANSNSQLKNIYINATGTPANDYRVPGGNNSMPGTPILAFRYLNPATSADLELINKVKNGEIQNIDETTFPINVTSMTIGNISVTSASGGMSSNNWCSSYDVNATKVQTLGYNVDAVIMIMYYTNDGYNGSNPTQNIKRLGFMHIKTMDWVPYTSGSTTNYASSRIYFDCLWQKYDYDYSKL